MNSRGLLKIVLVLFGSIAFGLINVNGQTYTSSGLSSNWNDPNAWIKTNPNGNPNFGLTANVPPLGGAPNYPYTSPVNIIINHEIFFNGGNTSIGGGNYGSIIVNTGGSLSFNGNLTVNNSGGNLFVFQINDGARFTVAGILGIQAGATFNSVNGSNRNPKTFVQVNNLTFLNAGSGQSVNVGVNTIFNVINQTRLEGGGSLNIQGEFSSNTLNSANSGGSQVNVSGNGILKTSGNMQIDGYPFYLTGNASVLVEGNLTITNSGNSSLNINGPSTNFTVLGTGSSIASGKNPSGTCFQTPENNNNCFNSACLEIIETSVNATTKERIYIFNCSALWSAPQDSAQIAGGDSLDVVDSYEALVVAGGGGGGRGASAGGGGAGGIIFIPDLAINGGSDFQILVGKGGGGSTSTNSRGQNGGDSQIEGFSAAIGGGGGGSILSSVLSGNSGGSGGGGASEGNSNNSQVGNGGNRNNLGFGNRGGNGSDNGNNSKGGGGGGSGGDGETKAPGNRPGGNGGIGLEYSISGSSNFYAAGGAGTGRRGGGTGGSGIGGNGDGTGTSRNGRNGTGSGGGATSSGAGGNGGSGVVIIRSNILRILPIELLDFEVIYDSQNRQSNLSWTTAKEWNNSHFEIQRSVNDVKNWETIAEVNGAGYSDQILNYSFVDKNLPTSGGNIFYRIRQIDYDGKSTLSKTRAVRVERLNSAEAWVAYPNPSASGTEITIDLRALETYSDEAIWVQVSDIRGVSRSYSVSKPADVASVVNSHLRYSETGVYLVQIIWGNQSQQLKILRN